VTADEIEQLAESRRLIESRRDEISREFHEILRRHDPETSALFRGETRDAGGCELGVLLDLLVQANENPRRLVAVAAELGRHHASVGVHPVHFQTTAVALLQAFDRALGDALTSDVRATWAEAFALVSALMERAAIRSGSALEFRNTGEVSGA